MVYKMVYKMVHKMVYTMVYKMVYIMLYAIVYTMVYIMVCTMVGTYYDMRAGAAPEKLTCLYKNDGKLHFGYAARICPSFFEGFGLRNLSRIRDLVKSFQILQVSSKNQLVTKSYDLNIVS